MTCRSRFSASALCQPDTAHRMPQWAPRLRTDQDRQLRDRRRVRAGSDLRRFSWLLRISPGPLGADVSSSSLAWQTHDLEHMLLAARRLGVPMIIGSAGDTGTNSRAEIWSVQIIKDLARKHALPTFRVGWFHSAVPRAELERRLGAGEVIAGLDVIVRHSTPPRWRQPIASSPWPWRASRTLHRRTPVPT